jgi:hypothetical protein
MFDMLNTKSKLVSELPSSACSSATFTRASKLYRDFEHSFFLPLVGLWLPDFALIRTAIVAALETLRSIEKQSPRQFPRRANCPIVTDRQDAMSNGLAFPFPLPS